jgi:anti-sigma factor RsiW
MRHPEEISLVRYLDADLPAREAGKVASHLESCSQCRAAFEALQSTVADCASYRRNVLAAMPAPPAEWRDLYRDFSRIDESLAHEPLLVRLARPLVHAGAPRWAMAAVLAMLVVLGVFYQLRQAPSVQAATLLKRAIATAEAKARPVHRIRVRTGNLDFTRVIGPQAPLTSAAAGPSFEALVKIGALFSQAHYPWNDPLSARSFEQWREQQVHTTDEVSTVAAGYRIRTVAREGEIAEASITFEASDLTPVDERIEFRDNEWVELTDIAESTTESGGITAAPRVEVPVRAAELPSRPAAFAPGPSASISDELQVLSALHEVEADLGDPIEVSLANGKVLVSGRAGLLPGRQQKIQAALANMPLVEMQFDSLQPAAIPPQAALSSAGGSANPRPVIQSRVEKQLGGRAAFDRFSAQILDSDEDAMKRVYALHTLAQKFPADTESQLNAKDRELLTTLSREHAAVLSQKVSTLESLLLPTLSSLGGTAALVHAAPHAAWQSAVEDLFRSSTRVDKSVSIMLGMTPSDGSTASLPTDLLSALKDLQSNLDDCQRLIAK